MKEEEGTKDTRGCSKKKGTSGIRNIFMHADAFDVWLMTFGILGAVGDGLSTPAANLLVGRITNNLGNGPSSSSSVFTHNIDKNMVIFLYLACGTFMASFLEGYCWTRTGDRQASRMRVQYLKAVLRQEIAYFDLKGASTADVITSVSSDSLIIQDVLSEKVPNFIMNGATFLGSYFVGFMLAWRLTLVALPTVVLLIIPGLLYGRMLMTLTKKIRTEYNKASTIAEQAISSIRTVYSFVGENKTMAEFSAALDNSAKLGLCQGLIKGIAIGSNAVTFAIWALMNWYGSHLVMYYGIPGGNILAAGLSIVSGGLAFGSGLANVKYIAEAISAGERVMVVLKRVPEIDSESMEGEILDGVSGEVEFRGIEFAYPSRLEDQILKDFNLKIPSGRTVALVGGSGSGKSTVIALLERFYDPARGEILLDGVDIKKLKIKWLRSLMGLVSQEPALFDTSIKENILFGKEDATMEEVVTAAKAAHAHNFISHLPDGYDTQAGARGVQLSGGQKQRIAIARAILRSPKILLLDEATSALDSESEQIVQEALDLASVGRTTLVIAHRLSTIRNADVIAVVQGGKVMEIGGHDQLMNEKGLYSSLIRLQQMSLATEELGVLPPLPWQTPPSSFNTPPPSGGNPHESDEPKQHLPVSYFRRLLMLNKPEWKHATFGCLSAIFFGGIQPLFTFTLGSTASVYFLKDQNQIKSKAKAYSLIFLFLSIFSFLINIVQHYSFGAMGEYLTKRVREQMLFKLLAFEIGWFDQEKNSSGAICSRLASDAYAVRSLVGDRMSLIIQAFSAVTIAWTMGLIISWRLALVIIAIQPIVIICFYGRKVLLSRISNKVIKAQSASSKLASEAVSNLRTVTAFSSQDHMLHLFHLAQQSPHRESILQSWFAGLGLGASQSLMRCTWALALWYGSKLMLHGDITAKPLFQTFTILISSGRLIADAGATTTGLAKGIHAISNMFEVLDQDSRIEPEDPTGFIPDKLNGSVEIVGIDFAYPTRPEIIIFKAFSLTIEAGKSTALVGQSGSGKSTIIGLIERFYDPLQGTIRIDGRDIKSYHLRTLRRHIALVGQEPVLFSGSIRENIKYGVKQATEAEVEEATRAANAHDFICSLKDGYDTWCGDQGLQLSGGQKQRIAIARAILKKPTILLLDEATSALDSRSEKVVQEALEQVMVGTTSVVVAHRLSTIKNCDLIVVLQKGRLVEIGTHASLLAKGSTGSYCRLVRHQ